MSFPRHFFTAIQYKIYSFVMLPDDLNFKILHDEHLPGHWVLHKARLAFWFAGRVDLMLKLHLHRWERIQNHLYTLVKTDFLFKM